MKKLILSLFVHKGSLAEAGAEIKVRFEIDHTVDQNTNIYSNKFDYCMPKEMLPKRNCENRFLHSSPKYFWKSQHESTTVMSSETSDNRMPLAQGKIFLMQ